MQIIPIISYRNEPATFKNIVPVNWQSKCNYTAYRVVVNAIAAKPVQPVAFM